MHLRPTSNHLLAFALGFAASVVIGLVNAKFQPDFQAAKSTPAQQAQQPQQVAPAQLRRAPANAPRIDPNDPNIARRVSNQLADVVDRVMPSVVVVKITGRKIVGLHPFFGAQAVEGEIGQGSGVIFDRRGYVLTNSHVLEDAEGVIIELADGTEYKGDLVGFNSQTDIAVIKILSDVRREFPAIPFANSDRVRVGEMCMAIGAPYSLSGTVTQGIVSQKGRAQADMPLLDFIQTSAAINPGNSGGPLINVDGQLIGINTFIHTAPGGDRGNIGLGFAVPANVAIRVAELIRDGKRSDLAWIGVVMMQAPRGIIIRKTVENSPADDAGIRAGDFVLTVDGKDIRSMEQLRAYLTLKRPGDPVSMKIIRDGKMLEIPIHTRVMPKLKTLYK